MLSNHDIVPVIMFHSVGLAGTDWVFSHISEPLERFEEKIATLSRSGYRFILWGELYEHMAGRRKVPGKSVMLTFDDGYLDNWVYAFPVLRKYGAKATIFVNPEFVDYTAGIRPNCDDLREGKISPSGLQATGFLSWPEMRAMEASGLIDIQSHSLTHTWYYSSPAVTDFHRPGDGRHPWLAWNARPERKPYYMAEDQSGFIPAGTPIYEHEKALACRRYFPPEPVLEGLTLFVRESGGADFFLTDRWKEELMALHASLMEAHAHEGRMETRAEYRKRVLFELTESKRLLEENLGKRVDYICWPGGGYNEVVHALASEAGYKSSTLASRDQSSFRNLPGIGPEQVKRVGSFSRYHLPGKPALGYASGRYFLCGIERHKGSLFHTWLGRALLAGARLRQMARLG